MHFTVSLSDASLCVYLATTVAFIRGFCGWNQRAGPFPPRRDIQTLSRSPKPDYRHASTSVQLSPISYPVKVNYACFPVVRIYIFLCKAVFASLLHTERQTQLRLWFNKCWFVYHAMFCFCLLSEWVNVCLKMNACFMFKCAIYGWDFRKWAKH